MKSNLMSNKSFSLSFPAKVQINAQQIYKYEVTML